MVWTPPRLRHNWASPRAWCANTWFEHCSTAANVWTSTAMTTHATPCSTHIERDPICLAAAEWYVRLHSGEISIEEALAWQRWLNESPANSRAFARIEEVSHVLRTI